MFAFLKIKSACKQHVVFYEMFGDIQADPHVENDLSTEFGLCLLSLAGTAQF